MLSCKRLFRFFYINIFAIWHKYKTPHLKYGKEIVNNEKGISINISKRYVFFHARYGKEY